MNRVIIALDTGTEAEAWSVVDAAGEDADFYKVGFELYTRVGPSLVKDLKGRGKRVFLDLKLHDIPNTVGRAVAAASELGADFLTVHASGGPAMLEAARRAADGETKLLGVTVLTSMTPDDVARVWGREIRSIREEVGRLASSATEAGLHGVVASALEASWLRGQLEEDHLLVTPGIRPADADRGDQARVTTPAEAIEAGADYLVVGRPITRAADPGEAFAAIRAEVEAAVETPPALD